MYLYMQLKKFLADSEAATTVEYAVMLALIIGTCIVAISAFGGESGALWGNTMTSIGDSFSTN